ncbi:lipopolysaccharide biosynthesis protein [Parabacteroides pacaensis]|uniref:lipopolysaccharide biosynthesis protein n=1 Tax=Parabacteroides pacaensis TaxID=2086575 RepID=UPI000D11031B|nr:lipopolysaccharide biosynthesis protein [Parabacteroides pacaensis]
MTGGIRKLAKETAVYGVSSILGRVLNWLLVPMYVRVLDSTGQYGIVTNLYAWTALLLVLLTYGMETGFFRFVNKEEKQPMEIYSTSLISVGISSFLFVVLGSLFLQPIASALGYGDTSEYVEMLLLIVAIDAFTCIPFAYLRYTSRPLKFAAIKLLNIFILIGLNLFFLLLCPWLYTHFPASVSWFYIPDYGVGYIFVSNLIASSVTLIALFQELTGFKYQFSFPLWRRMLKYSFPILILGIAGVLNQTVDKILFPFLFADRDYADAQLGIYGACFKIAVIMVMFIQAFRYAYEPFIFAKNKNDDCKQAYSEAMKYFVIFALLIFLGVIFYLDVIKYLVPPEYYPGLKVVPIVMLGEFFFGIYFNLSLWYKVIDETKWGAYFSTLGCLITVVIILVFGPIYSYMACVWASFVCNLVMMLLSYFIGQKKYPIHYDLKTIFVYFALTAILYVVAMLPSISNEWLRLGYRSILLIFFILFVIKRDLPLQELPFINRYIKK